MDDDVTDGDDIDDGSMAGWVDIACPYCGETFSTRVDVSAGSQRYVEDCAVCCRPIEVAVAVDAAGALDRVDVATDRE